ncbi:MAG: GNAT family N-acetyltransferase [Chloroflexi bacterium]|nr:GNAT family N-acetyltransferase [Chloroflexota bacterium]
MTTNFHLRPAEVDRDFGLLAAWFTRMEDEESTEAGLREEYERNKERVTLTMADNEDGKSIGFYWASRNKVDLERLDIYLYVTPDQRGRGVGRALYADVARLAASTGAKRMRVSVSDGSPADRSFAERRGFTEKRHHFGMSLDLAAFDDRPFEAVIERLKGEGFEFTSMDALGNTEEAQRKLYALNDSAAATTPGAEGEHPWASFEDFQKSVCQAKWYIPSGQMVVVDTSTGEWAALSAITRFDGKDYAYNLFTGVDPRYRNRGLGQAVKVTALRFARQVLKVDIVRTHHNFKNQPMIAIDRKLGYAMMPGTYLMEKVSE